MNQRIKDQILSLLSEEEFLCDWVAEFNSPGLEIYHYENHDYEDIAQRLYDLMIQYGSEEDVESLIAVFSDYDKAIDYLRDFCLTLEKYNRRLENSIDDLWQIFLENTTHNPDQMIKRILEDCFRSQNLIEVM